MAPCELQLEAVGDESQVESNERCPNLVTLSLFLRVLITLLETPDTVSRAPSRAAALAAEGWGGGWGGDLASAGSQAVGRQLQMPSLPRWASQKGNSDFDAGKKNAGPPATHPGDASA